jgi:hypothetical protein
MRRQCNIAITVLGLAVVFLLGVSSASATSITAPTGTVATPTIKAESEGHVELHNPIAKIACVSSFEGAVESHGTGKSASGKISALSFTACTDSWHVTVAASGTFSINHTSGYNGDVFSSSATVETTRFGITCRYATSNTTVGTLTGGSSATIDIVASIPFHSGSVFCGAGATSWTGSYKLTSPTALYVDGDLDPEPGTTLTSPTGTVATPTIKAESEGHVSLDHPVAKIQCQWVVEGTVKSHGSGAKAKVPLSSLSTTGCTESWHATTVSAGELEIEGTSVYSGTVTWTGGTVEMTRSGLTCRYKAENMHFGTIEGGTPATISIKGNLPFHSGSPLCGEESYSLTGSLKLSSPGSLFIDGKDSGPPPAQYLTSPTGSVATSTIKAQSEGRVVFDNPVAVNECKVTIEGISEKSKEGKAGSVVLTSLAFSECANGWDAKNYAGGRLEIEWTSGYNGTVSWTGATFELTQPAFGLVCRYSTNNTHIGTITGGSPATVHINAAIPFHSGSVGCPNGTDNTRTTGSLQLTSPTSLFIDKS